MRTENPPASALATCTVTPLSDENVCPAIRAVVVSSWIGAVLFCAWPSGSEVCTRYTITP